MDMCIHMNEMNEVMWPIAIKIAFSYVSWQGMEMDWSLYFKVLDVALMFKNV